MQYRLEPCDFLCFCFSDDFLYGSSRSTKPDVLAGLRAPPNWLAGVCTTLLTVRLFDDGVVRLDGDDILQFLQGVQFTRSGCFRGEGRTTLLFWRFH